MRLCRFSGYMKRKGICALKNGALWRVLNAQICYNATDYMRKGGAALANAEIAAAGKLGEAASTGITQSNIFFAGLYGYHHSVPFDFGALSVAAPL